MEPEIFPFKIEQVACVTVVLTCAVSFIQSKNKVDHLTEAFKSCFFFFY